MGRPISNLIGQKFNKLLVINMHGVDKSCNALWLCKCDCGNETIVQGAGLKNNKTKSCGCYRKEYMSNRQLTHKLSKTKIYEHWSSMNKRCNPSNYRQSERYFNRGICVCEKWKSFEGFYEDMNSTYSDGLSLDRIDNDKGYFKENCRWADMKVQCNNRATNIYFTVDGITDTLSNTARRYNTTGKRAHTRIKYGWNVEDAFKIPPYTKRISHK